MKSILFAAMASLSLALNSAHGQPSNTSGVPTTIVKTSLAPAVVSNPAQTNKPLVVTLDEATLDGLRALPSPWWKDLLPLASTLIGAVIALCGGYWATTRSHRLQVARQKEQDAEFVHRLEACIATELEMLGKFYDAGIGKDLAEPQKPQPLRVHFALTEKWFTVFEANANHLGKLEEQKSDSIIKIYGLMKSMVEYFRINNLLLDQVEALEKHLETVLDDDRARAMHQHLLRLMTRLAGMLKDLEANLKQEIERFHGLRGSTARTSQAGKLRA